MQTHFQRSIIEKGLVPAGFDPRHIESYILLQYSHTSHLDWATIRREVKIAVSCIKEGGVEAAESLAKSYGR
jgi:hypothetical protein